MVFDGIVWDGFVLGVLPMFAPSFSASLPMLFNPFMWFPSSMRLGTPAVDLFAARAMGWAFIMHGVVRAAAGLNPEDSTFAWLAASSHIIEFYFWACAHPNKTMFLPLLIWLLICAYLCATMIGCPVKDRKGSHAY